jgi:hypothetical protein
MQQKNLKLIAALFGMLLHGALSAQAPAAPAKAAVATPTAAPAAFTCVAPTQKLQANFLTDAARLMAGFTTAEGGPLATLSASPAITAHRSNFEAAWKKLDTRQLDLVKSFGSTELVPLTGSAPLFYPFSGPDFLYAHAFFPNASSYVLTGLEPVGAVPILDQFKADELAASLADLRKSLHAILSFSFFKTNDMRVDFRRSRFQGVVPVLMTFAAKSGFDVKSASFFILQADGSRCVTDAQNVAKVPAGAISGVELGLQKTGATATTSLVYLSSDIGDGGIVKTPQYGQMVRALKPGATFLKSASFLMHKGYFSQIRSLILEVSPIVLQDDSGIPYKNFDLNLWQPNFYGTYVKPIPLFANFVQPDLTTAFKQFGSKPLSFGIGYRYGKRDSSLLLMTQKAK